MNERIKQLWEDNDTIEVCYPEQGSPVSVSATTLEKFAELIVRECCHIMNTTAKKAEESNTYMGDDVPTRVHQYTIKQHFGVEE